ncbi:iron chelate uptake ABC transporter family permease subunit [Methanoplanus sp. FWC-SCC4]|uniref:Cobalamin import system permease protein BtuC n=1 Tax=Methanochimaera problematica TaxID=2609417 RepID=A0AA97F9X1_9EURY|nr:iron chelate uptake ABC transporter family permease subunit [Methanoplanus sp. FWC-SCC4]WOF15490.1 iron chelate uptake ABC transporter family permease subunit [Methanoplanus sp. FWC-SCC4]
MKNKKIFFSLLVLTGLITFIISLLWGSSTVELKNIFPNDLWGFIGSLIFNNSPEGPCAFFDDPTTYLIVYDIRLPRAIIAFFAGCGLAVAGTVMQALFKNPMADPYIIGTSSGGALGAAISIVAIGGLFLPLFAFFGAMGATFLVYGISKRNGRVPVETLLLSGIAVSMFLSAFLSFIMYNSGKSLHQIMFWMMGGFWNADWGDAYLALIIPVLSVILFAVARDLNALSLGEEDAVHLGVNVEILKKAVLATGSFITGIAVAISGAIGFVGLIVPHTMRLIAGPDHRVLLPASMIAGGIFLMCADTLTRTFFNEMPVGIITAFVGAPFFVYLLRRRMSA